MAARKRNWQTNKTREKIRDTIRTKQLVERLEAHALCENPDKEIKDLKTGELRAPHKMTPSQIKAAQVLLDRTMPVLSSAEITETTEQQSPEAMLAMLEGMLPPDMFAALKAKFLPKAAEAQESPNGPH